MSKLKDGDYILEDGAGWFTVGNASVRIRKTDEGVAVDIYGNQCEFNGEIASAYVFDSELVDDNMG